MVRLYLLALMCDEGSFLDFLLIQSTCVAGVKFKCECEADRSHIGGPKEGRF